jgi:hypothetical protein
MAAQSMAVMPQPPSRPAQPSQWSPVMTLAPQPEAIFVTMLVAETTDALVVRAKTSPNSKAIICRTRRCMSPRMGRNGLPTRAFGSRLRDVLTPHGRMRSPGSKVFHESGSTQAQHGHSQQGYQPAGPHHATAGHSLAHLFAFSKIDDRTGNGCASGGVAPELTSRASVIAYRYRTFPPWLVHSAALLASVQPCPLQAFWPLHEDDAV